MASTTKTNLTGTEAIEAFVAAGQAGTGIRVWAYSPNGGMGGPTAENSWGSEDWVREILDGTAMGLDPEETEYEYDPTERMLDVRCIRERGVHQYYELRYAETPDRGRERVAYLGAHGGFDWEDQSAESESLETLLRSLRWDADALAEFGLACCEDYDNGDDGGYWLVADAATFAETARKCQELDERWDGLDAADVLAYLRDGTEPEAEDED